MENITRDELRKNFENHHNYKYENEQEFEDAVYSYYTTEIMETGETLFTGGDLDFIVADW